MQIMFFSLNYINFIFKHILQNNNILSFGDYNQVSFWIITFEY